MDPSGISADNHLFFRGICRRMANAGIQQVDQGAIAETGISDPNVISADTEPHFLDRPGIIMGRMLPVGVS